MPMSCRSCPERSQRVWERAGVGPRCSVFTHLCQGDMQQSCQRRGEHSPPRNTPGDQYFRTEGGLTPRGCPRVSPQRPHAWAQPEGKDRATTAWALGLTPHALPSAATSPEGSAVSLRPSQTFLQKAGRALLPPLNSSWALLASCSITTVPGDHRGAKEEEARGPSSLQHRAVDFQAQECSSEDRENSLNGHSSFYKEIFDSRDNEVGVLYSEGLHISGHL